MPVDEFVPRLLVSVRGVGKSDSHGKIDDECET